MHDFLDTRVKLTKPPLPPSLPSSPSLGSMLFHQVKGGVLAGIVLITVIVWFVDHDGPSEIFSIPNLQYGVTRNIDLRPSSLSWDMLPPLLAFLFVGLFDISGVMFGLSSLAKIMEEDGHIPGSMWAFLGSALGTMVAAMAGCSPIIIHVESAAGIREGGRTGLTAVVVGLLFFLSLFFAPLFGKVPTAATAPILILVGAMMIGESQHIDWADMSQAIPAFLTSMMMPFTFSIPNGILFGVGMSLTFFVTTGEFLCYLPRWMWGGGKGKEGGREGGAFRVVVDGYVTSESGTGVVHQAPAFGEDDYRVCLAQGVIGKGTNVPCPVDSNGRFTEEVRDFVGKHVKEADTEICVALKGKGRMVEKATYSHSYPFCWRSDTPLIYKAVPSWFVAVGTVKEKLLANNQKTYWVPAFVKEHRFHNWLADAKDWGSSRNRSIGREGGRARLKNRIFSNVPSLLTLPPSFPPFLPPLPGFGARPSLFGAQRIWKNRLLSGRSSSWRRCLG